MFNKNGLKYCGTFTHTSIDVHIYKLIRDSILFAIY